jgi:hypothetical protein
MGEIRKHWTPKNNSEKLMLPKYRSWTVADRMREAVRLVLDEGVAQAEAARRCGVSRQRVNMNVKEARELAEERAARAALAREARNQAIEQPPEPEPETVGEVQEFQNPSADGTIVQPHIVTARRIPSFREFNEIYFSNEVCPDCGVHHETPDFHLQAMDLLEDDSKRLKLINFAPYHAKSTLATVKSTLYEIIRDPASRTALISRAGPLAEAFLYQIKQHLTDPDLYNGAAGNLIEDWGPFYNPGYWAADQIYIAGRSGAQKEPTVSTYGFGKQIYGRRFDRMIFDDVADLENQNTPEAIAKMYKKIWQEYSNRVGKTGRLIFVGTRVASGDIYSLLDDVDGMNVLRFPCILDEDDQLMLWPEHFPYQAAVAQRNAMSEADFQLVYQNIDTPGYGASFTQEALDRSHDNERFIGQYGGNWALVAGLDPAGANEQAGYTALVLLGVDLETGRRHLVDLINVKQMKAPQVIAQVLEWADRYPLRELRVEVNGLQAQLYQYNQELQTGLSNRGVRIVPHTTHKGNKWDPQFGVEAMATLYHNQNITTPWADANSRKKFRELEQQLMAFPMGNVSDLVMAMWFAEIGCRELFQRTQLPLFDGRRRVPGRISRNRAVLDFGNKSIRGATQEEQLGYLEGGMPHKPAARFVNVPTERHAGVTV